MKRATDCTSGLNEMFAAKTESHRREKDRGVASEGGGSK